MIPAIHFKSINIQNLNNVENVNLSTQEIQNSILILYMVPLKLGVTCNLACLLVPVFTKLFYFEAFISNVNGKLFEQLNA